MQHRYGIAIALALATVVVGCDALDGSIVGRRLVIRSAHDDVVVVHGIARIYADRVLLECVESRSGRCHAGVHAPEHATASTAALPAPAVALARFVVPAGEAHVLQRVPIAFRLCLGADDAAPVGCAEVAR